MKKWFLVVIFLVAAYLRLAGLDWDSGQHLHPDERFLTTVSLDIGLPSSVAQYFETSSSPANPHNRGYPFFVYGLFPLFFTKIVSMAVDMHSYQGLVMVGRFISALFDLGTCGLVFLIAKKASSKFSHALVAVAFYSLAVLPIQLSHFFATDTFMVFFLMLSTYFLIHFSHHPTIKSALLLGISFGLSISAKVSAVFFLPLIALVFITLAIKRHRIIHLILFGLIFTAALLLSIRVAFPYLFAGIGLNSKLLSNWSDLSRMSRPDFYFPPSIQWIKIVPGLFPLQNMFFWGLGLPMSLVAICGLVYSFIKKPVSFASILLSSLVLIVFIYQSTQSAQPLRYFYPLYPALSVLSASLLVSFVKNKVLLAAIFLLFAIWPLAFVSVYHSSHSRVSASRWIYSHIPPGSALTCEYWDDCLPLSMRPNEYLITQISPYDLDTPEKWQKLSTHLSNNDYIVLSSNRLYGSILTVPDHYPQTAKYYQLLFSGSLGFTKVAQFTSRPSIPFPLHLCLNPQLFTYGQVSRAYDDCSYPGISFVDDYADETFTVYDHPKVTIFQNTKHLTSQEINSLISD